MTGLINGKIAKKSDEEANNNNTTCIEYDYMHMHVRTLHKKLCRVFNMIGSRYNQIEYK